MDAIRAILARGLLVAMATAGPLGVWGGPHRGAALETAPLELELQVVGAVGGRASGVAYSGGYTYVGVGMGLEVIDVADPEAPQWIGTARLQRGAPPGETRAIEEYGQYAIVAADRGGLRVFDMSMRRGPRQVAQIEVPYATDVVVAEGHAFLRHLRGFSVVDLSRPTEPQLVTTRDTRNQVGSLAAADGYLFVTLTSYPSSELSGLYVYDIGALPTVTAVAMLPPSGKTYGSMAVDGGFAYIASSFDDDADHKGMWCLVVVDVRDARDPVEVARFDGAAVPANAYWAAAKDVWADGGYAYVRVDAAAIVELDGESNSVSLGELSVVDVHDPTHPFLIGTTTLGRGIVAMDLAVGNGLTYVTVADESHKSGGIGDEDPAAVAGLRLLRGPEYGAPVEVGRYVPLSGADDVVASDGLAFIRSAYPRARGEPGFGAPRITIVDVSDPGRPSRQSWLDIGQVIEMGVLHPGGFLVALARDQRADAGTLSVTDARDPRSPRVVGALGLSGVPVGMTMVGPCAYVLMEKGDTLTVYVVDLSEPTRPTTVAEVEYDSSNASHPYWRQRSPVLAGNHLFFWADVAAVLDVSSPKSPRRVDTESEYGFAGPLAAGAITASGTTIFTAHGGGGFDIVLRAFDVSNPARPVIVDSVVVEEGQGEDLWPGGPEAVTFRAGRVFVTMCHGYATDCAVRVYDGTWPDRLRLVGDFSTQVYARRVAIAGCQALIADGYGGLLVTSASRSGARVPDAPGESAALPNIVDQLFLPYVNVGAVCLLDR